MPSPDPDGLGGVPGGAEIRNVTINSGKELVWKSGITGDMLEPGQEEEVVNAADGRLHFGNFIKIAWVKINKTTTNPTDKDELFTFNVTMSNGTEIHPELTIENDETFNMTGLIRVPSGETTIGEILLPTGWKNNMTGTCFVQNYTNPDSPTPVPDSQVPADLTVTLKTLQALECGFVNDNTAFVKIIKNTTNPTDKDETFNFNYTDVTNNETSTTVTVLNGTSMNMTDLIQVPTGLTSIEEFDLPTGWKNNMTGSCVVQNYTDTDPRVKDGLPSSVGGLSATLEPWQALECTFVNDNTAFVKIIKNTTNPTWQDETFNFNYTDSNSTETSTTVIVQEGDDMNMTELIAVPAGLTSIEEFDLPTGWKNNMTGSCVVQNYTDTDPRVKDGAAVPSDNPLSHVLKPWQALECTFVNDNTAFVKIIKNTTNPTDKNETFNFNYTDSTTTETGTSVTVFDGFSMNMTGLIQVPTGLTSIEEIDPLPTGWKNNMTTQCSVVTYNQDQSEASRIDLAARTLFVGAAGKKKGVLVELDRKSVV
jgi:hypothetical protein